MNPILQAFIGGMIIGTSALILLFLNGRILGVSGILGGALSSNTKDRHWRIASVFGFLLGGLFLNFFQPSFFAYDLDRSWPVIAVAGLLVGFGTQLGSGCTSGHGICGISRLSFRSITATCLFMISGMITVYLMRAL